MPIVKNDKGEYTPDAVIEGFNLLERTMVGYDERLKETDGKMSEIHALVKDVKSEFADRARQELGGGLATKLLDDYDVEKELSWDAFHKAPTDVKVKGRIKRLTEFEPADRSDVVAQFQEKSDQLYILAAALKLVDADGMPKMERVRNLKFYQKRFIPARDKMKAAMEKDGFSTSVAGSGSEWDPNSFSTRLWLMARLPYKLEGVIPTFPLPRSPFIFPIELADLVSYLVGEITSAPSSAAQLAGFIPDGKGATVITSSKTFTAKKLAAMAFVSKEAQEDDIVPLIPYIQSKLVFALNNAKEKAILRGFKTRGTAATNSYDSDTTAATNAAMAFDGLYDYALNVTAATVKDAGGVNINTDDLWREHIRGARKLMDDEYKGDAANLVLVVSGNTAIDVGSCAAFRTAYAMGGMSTNRLGDSTGFRPDGLGDFIVSKFTRSDLGAGGFNTGVPANDVYTAAIQFFPEAWLMGEERQLRIEVARERYFEYDVDAAKITYRADLKAMLAGKHTVITSDLLAA